jgi:hypothetical protein
MATPAPYWSFLQLARGNRTRATAGCAGSIGSSALIGIVFRHQITEQRLHPRAIVMTSINVGQSAHDSRRPPTEDRPGPGQFLDQLR